MTEAQRHSEVRRRFRGAWRSFCKSGGLEVFFAGLMAPLHPLHPLTTTSATVVGVYINTMKKVSILVLISNNLFHIISSKVSNEKLLIDRVSLLPCLCVSMLFGSLVEIKN